MAPALDVDSVSAERAQPNRTRRTKPRPPLAGWGSAEAAEWARAAVADWDEECAMEMVLETALAVAGVEAAVGADRAAPEPAAWFGRGIPGGCPALFFSG